MTLGELIIRLKIDHSGVTQQTTAVTTGLKSVDTAAKNANTSLASVSGGLKNMIGLAGGVLGLASAVRIFVGFMKSSVSAFLEDEAAAQKLKAALDGNTTAFNNLRRQADQLQQESKGLFSNELINSAQTFLADQERTEAQIKKTIEAAVKMSIVTGKDLLTATKELDGTYEGVIGRLGKLDSRFGELTDEQLRNGGAIDLVNNKYSNWQEKLDSTTGKIKNLETAFGEFKEGVGGGFLEQLTKDMGGLSDSADVSQQAFNDAGKALGSYIGWIIKGGVTGMIFFKGLELVIDAAKRSAIVLKDAARATLNLVDSFDSFVSNVPVISSAWNILKNAADPYLNKLREILGAQKNINSGKGLPEDQYTPDGKRVNTKDPMKDPANVGTKDKTQKTPKTSGSTQSLKEEKENLDEVAKAQAKLNELTKDYENALGKNYIGLSEELKIQIDELQKRIDYLIKGIKDIDISGKIGDIDKLRELMNKVKDDDKYGKAIEPEKKPRAREAKGEEKIEPPSFEGLVSTAQRIADIINKKPTNLFDAFSRMFQIAQAIALMMNAAKVASVLGPIGGIFGMLGTLFFNKGTDPVVPGSGNSDTVPAWLTPGEVVINKPRVMQLVSQYGTGFIKWLNGGGSLLPAIPGHYNTGGIVQNIIQERRAASSSSNLYLNGKILDARERRRIAKDGIYLNDLTNKKTTY